MKNNIAKDKFTDWLRQLSASGRSGDEINRILTKIAKHSGLETYETIMLSLTEDDMSYIEKIEDEKEAERKIEELFKLRTGMTIDELVANIQTYLIEE